MLPLLLRLAINDCVPHGNENEPLLIEVIRSIQPGCIGTDKQLVKISQKHVKKQKKLLVS